MSDNTEHPNIQQDQKDFNDLCEMDNFSIRQVLDGDGDSNTDVRIIKAIELAEKLIHEEVNVELLLACQTFRRLLHENNGEDYSIGTGLNILSEILDGAVDSIYVILNLLNVLDLPFKETWIEVHRANITKAIPDTDPSTGNPIPGTFKIRKRDDGKILKPEEWVPPDIEQIILNHYEKRRNTR